MLYVAYTGCQWRCLPREFGPWTRAWSQYRRWSRNGTWSRLLAALYRQVRLRAGRAEPLPSMVVVDTHLGRDASPAAGRSTTGAGRTARPTARSGRSPSTSRACRWRARAAGLDAREPHRRAARRHRLAGPARPARTRPGRPRRYSRRGEEARRRPRPRGPPGQASREAGQVRAASAGLAGRGSPRPAAASSSARPSLREHPGLGRRLAPGRLPRCRPQGRRRTGSNHAPTQHAIAALMRAGRVWCRRRGRPWVVARQPGLVAVAYDRGGPSSVARVRTSNRPAIPRYWSVTVSLAPFTSSSIWKASCAPYWLTNTHRHKELLPSRRR